jgi:hypothetical protein
MGNFCTHCGSKLDDGQKFCIQCGEKVAPEIQMGLPSSSPTTEPPPIMDDSVPPPPPPGGQVFVFRGPDLKTQFQPQSPQQQTIRREALKQGDAIRPSVESFGFQDKSTDLANKVIQSLNKSGFSTETGLGSMVGRMIRACLLDKTIYRETSINASLDKEAWGVIGLVIAFNIVGPYLLRFSFPGIISIISIGIVQLVSLLAWVFVVQIGSSLWLKRKMGFHQFFRPLAFAQSPGILQIIPVVGQFVNIWRLVTNMVAIRDVTGCQTFQAAVLSIVGFIGGLLATRYVPSIIGPIFSIF